MGLRLARAAAAAAALVLSAALAAAAADLDVLLKQGLEQVRKGDYKTAVARFEKAAELDPANLEALYLLAATHYSAKDYVRATRSLQKLLSLDPKNARALALENSIVAIVSGSRTSNTAEVEAPAGPALPDLLADAARLAAETDKRPAMEAYRRILAADRDNFDALLALAGLTERFGESFRAIEFYDRLVRRYPQRLEIYPALAGYLDRNVKADEAARIVEQYIAWGADKAEIGRIAAMVYLKGQDFPKAEAAIAAIVAAAPDDPKSQRLLVRLYQAMNEPRKLVDALKTLKRLTGNDAAVVTELSRTYEAQGVYDLALKVMGDIPPDMRDASYFKRLVELGRKSGEKGLVAGAFERMVEDSRGDRRLQLDYIDWLTETGDAKGAIAKIDEYLRADPKNPDLVKRLRRAAIEAKDDEVAFHALERYIDLFPNSFASRRRFQKLAEKLGRKVAIAGPAKDQPLPVFDDKEFTDEVDLIRQQVENIRGALKARLDHEVFCFGKGETGRIKYCNVRALERLVNECFMSRTEVEKLVYYRTLMDLFLKEGAGGVVLFVQFRKGDLPAEGASPEPAPEGGGPAAPAVNTELITIPNVGGKPVPHREAFDAAAPPRDFELPGKIVFDTEQPLAPGGDDYDDARLLERYDTYGQLVNRVETERRETLKEIVERCDSRVAEDLIRNMASIRVRAVVEGVKPAHLATFLTSITGAVSDKWNVDLLDEMERTYGLIAHIQALLVAKEPNLPNSLGQAKDEKARIALLARYFKPGDEIWTFLDLKKD